MSLLSSVSRINITKVISVTPTITASSAYVAGYQVGGIMTLTDAIRMDTQTGLGVSELVSITILDKAKQDAAINVFLFSASPTLASSDHAAFDLTDANLIAACIGVVSVGTTYVDTVSNSVSSTVNLNLPLQITSGTNLYAVATTSGTPTYASTSDLVFKFGFFVD